jgi:sarcosine oxidase
MDADVVVIGAGVMGLASAWRLAVAGVHVVVLEQFCVGHHHGSSHGPTRVFRVVYGDPLYVRMAQAAVPLWRELERASGGSLLEMTGGVQVDDSEVVAQSRRVLDSCGERAALGDAPTWFRSPEAGVLWVDNMGVIAADATVSSLRSVVTGSVVEDSRVESIELGDRAIVRTDHETLTADVCVVAAGAWTRPLLTPLGIDVPVRVTREQVLYFDTDTAGMVPFVHGVPHWVYGVPGTGVLKVAEHGTGAETTADERGFDLDEPGADRVREYVRRHLPFVDPDPVSFETCLYTTTPDEDFVIDRRGPLILCSACSGHGFKFAPLIGEAVAALALGDRPPVDLARFSLSRFA